MNDDERIAVLNLIEDYATARKNEHALRAIPDAVAATYAVNAGERAMTILREINHRLGGERPAP